MTSFGKFSQIWAYFAKFNHSKVDLTHWKYTYIGEFYLEEHYKYRYLKWIIIFFNLWRQKDVKMVSFCRIQPLWYGFDVSKIYIHWLIFPNTRKIITWSEWVNFLLLVFGRRRNDVIWASLSIFGHLDSFDTISMNFNQLIEVDSTHSMYSYTLPCLIVGGVITGGSTFWKIFKNRGGGNKREG